MAAQEVAHLRVEKVLQDHVPRMAQCHHEPHQLALGPADGHRPEIGPVELSLLAWQETQAQIRFGRPARPQRHDQVTEVIGTTPIAALADHLVEPAGVQLGPALQRLPHERKVGIDHRRARRALLRCAGRLLQRPRHRAVMQAEFAGNRPDRPAFDPEQAYNGRPGVVVNRHGLPSVSLPSAAAACRRRRSGRKSGRTGCSAVLAPADGGLPAAGSRPSDRSKPKVGDDGRGDASLFLVRPAGARDSAAGAPRACAGPAGCSDSAGPHRAGPGAARRCGRPACSRRCRDRRTSTPPPGSCNACRKRSGRSPPSQKPRSGVDLTT